MSRSRKVLLIGIFLVLGVAGALLLYQRATRPSRAVLALPESNFLLYVNLKAVHLIWDTGKPLVMEAEPEYQEFVRQTGFHFVRDLNEVAISQRNSSDPDTDSSAIFVGHFDQNRVRQYLQKLLKSPYQDRWNSAGKWPLHLSRDQSGIRSAGKTPGTPA